MAFQPDSRLSEAVRAVERADDVANRDNWVGDRDGTVRYHLCRAIALALIAVADALYEVRKK